MRALLLVTLLVSGQAPPTPPPAEQAAPSTSEEALARLTSWSAPDGTLPDAATVRDALGLSDLRVPTLRERANALRVELRELTRASLADGADAGSLDDAGALASDTSAQSALLTAQLSLIERLIADEVDRAQSDVQRILDEEHAARKRAEAEAKRAEEAQQRALKDALNARSALLERAYARVAEVEGAKVRAAQARAKLHDVTGNVLAEVREAGEDAARLFGVARGLQPGAREADEMLLEVREKQRALLDGVGAALAQRRTLPAELDGVEATNQGALDDAMQLGGALGSDERSDVERAIDALRGAVRSLDDELERLRSETSERWYRVAERRLDVATIHNDTRLVLLNRVSSEMSSRLHGLSADGADNVAVALRQLFWKLRFHVERRVFDALHLQERLSDPIELGKVVWALGLSVFALMLSTWLWRRGPTLWQRIRSAALRSVQSPTYARFIGSWLSLLEAATPRAFLIALALWLHEVLSPVAPEPELTVVVEIVVWALSYLLAQQLLHMLILRLARRRMSLTVPTKLRILRSVRLALRYGFIVAYVLTVTSDLVGQGVLFGAVRIAALLGALPVLATLVQRWRDDIVTAYLAYQPDSRLGRVVETARGEWYGFFVAVAAFGVVAGHGVGVLGRDFVLGFEQSRKALAYLFRLRIERQAQRRGFSPIDVTELPESVREAFADEPTDDPSLLVDRFDDIERAVESIRRFPAGSGSLLVHAGWGMGRTTWLRKLEREVKGDKPTLWWTPERRLLSVNALVASLGRAVGMSEPPSSLRELCSKLCDDGPRVIFLDGVELLFVRSLDGYGALESFAEIMARTRGSVFWALSAATPAYRHLCQTRFFNQHLGEVFTLGRWSESEIRELIQRRQRKSGCEASFEDLIVHDIEGDRLPAQVVETEEGYIRLLWNFAEGSPRVAQLFWLRSLYKTTSGQLRVRLYSAPAADDLEVLSERERFVLSAIHLHGGLTAEEAVRACRLPASVVRAHLDRGLALGLYTKSLADNEAFVVSLGWWEATLRYLRRKNLVS